MQSPVQDLQIQDWPKAATFLGYDEVRAIKPLPHLGWRDRLDCILCQEDSNLLAQDRGVPDCHRRLENTVELGRSPGELNRVSELCAWASETGWVAWATPPDAVQAAPTAQSTYLWWCSEREWGGWYRRWCVLRHPNRTPWFPNGTGQRCVGRNIVPEPYSLGYWQNGSWARVRTSHTVVPWTWEPGGKGNCSFFEKVGTAGPWTSGETETKWNRRFSSRPSTGLRSGAVLAVSWERANFNISGLPVSGPLRRLPGWLGAWLGGGGRRSPARGSTHRPMCRFGLGRSSSGGHRRAPTATGRLRPGPGGSGGLWTQKHI